MICRHCGRVLEPGWLACPNCATVTGATRPKRTRATMLAAVFLPPIGLWMVWKNPAYGKRSRCAAALWCVWFVGYGIYQATPQGRAESERDARAQAVTVPARGSKPVDPPIVSASQIDEAYAMNPVGAADRYKGKPLHVFGTVVNIVDGDTPAVTLSSETPSKDVSVTCNFDSDQRKSLDSLTIGERADIAGTCSDYTDSPVLDDCRLLSVGERK